MFYMSLALSVILFAVTSLGVGVARNRAKAYWWCWLGVLPGILPCIAIFPTYLLHALFVGVTATMCWRTGRGPATFIIGSLAVFAGTYAYQSVQVTRRLDRLAQEFPVVSLTDRLGYESHVPADRRTILTTRPAGSDTAERFSVNTREAYTLKALHEDYTRLFVNSSGFGVARMGDETFWLRHLDDQKLLPLPEPRTPGYVSPLSAETTETPTGPTAVQERLLSYHNNSLTDFLDPRRFGYVKDRKSSAGFRSHQFSGYPSLNGGSDANGQWRLQSLSLISLLKHPEPVAHVSDHMPRMDQLRDARTRPLDEFENGKLTDLRAGKEVVSEQASHRIRLLGAIVASEACGKCHAAEPGTLLGAFSYDLRRDVRE